MSIAPEERDVDFDATFDELLKCWRGTVHLIEHPDFEIFDWPLPGPVCCRLANVDPSALRQVQVVLVFFIFFRN